MPHKNIIVHLPRRFSKESWGGTESVILNLSVELLRQGYRVMLLTSDLLSTKTAETMQGLEIRRCKGFYPRWGLSAEAKKQLDNRGGNFFSLELFRLLLRTRDIKAIHLHTGGFIGAMGRLVAKWRRIPYFISLHGGQLDLPPEQMQQLLAPLQGTFNWGKILEWLFRQDRIYRDASAIFCLVDQERLKLQAQYPNIKVVRLPNGVDYRRFSQADGTRFRSCHGLNQEYLILSVGGFYQQKNQLTLVEAFSRLPRTGNLAQAHLLLIGVVYDQSYVQCLRQRVAELGLNDHVTFICNLDYESPDLADAYAAADLFVLPSRYETFGIVILEAWSAGKPVIAGCVGGIADYGVDNQNLLFADVESPESIAENIQKIAANPELAADLTRQGKEYARQNSWEKIAAALIDAYEQKPL